MELLKLTSTWASTRRTTPSSMSWSTLALTFSTPESATTVGVRPEFLPASFRISHVVVGSSRSERRHDKIRREQHAPIAEHFQKLGGILASKLGRRGTRNAEVMKDPWVPRLADNLSDPMVVATTSSEGLRHDSGSGTLLRSELARVPEAGEGGCSFGFRGVAVANRGVVNVCGRSSGRTLGGRAARCRPRLWLRYMRRSNHGSFVMSLSVLSATAGFFALLGAAVLVAWLAFSLGRWIGTHEARREDREHEGPVGSVVGATLGLLAFTLAITFNMAHTKHNDRKHLVREDVRAIETAYDRALLLPPDAAKVAHERLVEYARIRAFDTFVHPEMPLEEIVARSEQIQQELWLQAVAHREHSQIRFYMDALSAMRNIHAERITVGIHDHVPIPVWLSLIFVTALGMVTMGYQASLVGSKRARAMIPLIVAFCVILTMALDLDRPRQGILRVDQGPMIRLAAALESRSDR